MTNTKDACDFRHQWFLLTCKSPEIPLPRVFLERNRKMRLSDSFIFKGLLPLKMLARPCARLVSVLSGGKLIAFQNYQIDRKNRETSDRCRLGDSEQIFDEDES